MTTENTSRLSAALADRYKILSRLGEGGMATVYLAEDIKHNRKVAVKVLRPELAAVLGAERFVQEITTTANLQHPHILPLFDSGEADSFLYYVMPFIDGETLRDKLDRETQLGIDEAVKITTEVADALDYAHRQGVVHRDIKPENILLQDGRPMVADFGIALALSAAAGGRMTETGLSLGTPHYMSPEQATAEKEITNRSDIYSLGSVLFEMLAGEPPHMGNTAQAIIMKIVTEDAQEITELRKSVPPNVAAAVAKSLEKLAADRFDSADAFAAAMADPGFQFGLHNTAVAAAAGSFRGRGLVGSLSAAVLVLFALLVWSLVRNPGLPGPVVYDVALPDSAARWGNDMGIAVSSAGDFVIYAARHDGVADLWYRSLLDDATRRLAGSGGGTRPWISPDDSQVLFLRSVAGAEPNVEIMGIEGGPATVLATTDVTAALEWLPDGLVQVADVDGGRVRRIDPVSGALDSWRTEYCVFPAPLSDPRFLLCGGSGMRYAHQVDLHDRSIVREAWTQGADSSLVVGSQFRVIDDEYVVFVSPSGDIFAAPVDLKTMRVGRSVRLVTGVAMYGAYSAAAYGLSASGTLVYAPGLVGSIGRLVVADETSLDTLPFGPAAFQRFSPSPDGQRLAAVVQEIDGQELRVYDLATGSYVVLASARPTILQPVWSPTGDRLLLSSRDSVFVTRTTSLGTFEFLFDHPGIEFETMYWLPGEKLVGVDWDRDNLLSADLGTSPVTIDTIRGGGSFVRPSPGGRWLAYNSEDLLSLWLEPFPLTGERYQVATGLVLNPQWVSPTQFVVESFSGEMASLENISFERVRVSAGADPPNSNLEVFVDAPGLVETPGESFQVMPDGRILFLQGRGRNDSRFLRVVPNWVKQMKRAVDARQ